MAFLIEIKPKKKRYNLKINLHIEGHFYFIQQAILVNFKKPCNKVFLKNVTTFFVPFKGAEEPVADNAWQFSVLKEPHIVNKRGLGFFFWTVASPSDVLENCFKIGNCYFLGKNGIKLIVKILN